MPRILNFFKTAFKSFIYAFVIVYLGYFLVFGKNGIISYIQNKNLLTKISTEEQLIFEKRNQLENKVYRMYPSNLDADLLDEQYRRATGEISKNEVIYYY